MTKMRRNEGMSRTTMTRRRDGTSTKTMTRRWSKQDNDEGIQWDFHGIEQDGD